MICLLAENKLEAGRYAYGQQLDDNEWFFPITPETLLAYGRGFHVIVLPGFANLPYQYREKMYQMAYSRRKL